MNELTIYGIPVAIWDAFGTCVVIGFFFACVILILWIITQDRAKTAAREQAERGNK